MEYYDGVKILLFLFVFYPTICQLKSTQEEDETTSQDLSDLSNSLNENNSNEKSITNKYNNNIPKDKKQKQNQNEKNKNNNKKKIKKTLKKKTTTKNSIHILIKTHTESFKVKNQKLDNVKAQYLKNNDNNLSKSEKSESTEIISEENNRNQNSITHEVSKEISLKKTKSYENSKSKIEKFNKKLNKKSKLKLKVTKSSSEEINSKQKSTYEISKSTSISKEISLKKKYSKLDKKLKLKSKEKILQKLKESDETDSISSVSKISDSDSKHESEKENSKNDFKDKSKDKLKKDNKNDIKKTTKKIINIEILKLKLKELKLEQLKNKNLKKEIKKEENLSSKEKQTYKKFKDNNKKSKKINKKYKELNINSKDITKESKQTSSESKDITKESKQTSNESKDITKESKQTSSESKDITKESKQTSSESKAITKESKQTSTEYKDITKESKQTSTESKDNIKKSKKINKKYKELSINSQETSKEFKDINKYSKQKSSKSKDNIKNSKKINKDINQSEKTSSESKDHSHKNKPNPKYNKISIHSVESYVDYSNENIKNEIQKISTKNKKNSNDDKSIETKDKLKTSINNKFENQIKNIKQQNKKKQIISNEEYEEHDGNVQNLKESNKDKIKKININNKENGKDHLKHIMSEEYDDVYKNIGQTNEKDEDEEKSEGRRITTLSPYLITGKDKKIKKLKKLIMPQKSGLNTMLGTKSFYDLVTKSDTFIDKTELISDILSDDKILHFTRPKKWGRTVTLDMLKRFYELELDDYGNHLYENEKINKKLFKGGIKVDLFPELDQITTPKLRRKKKKLSAIESVRYRTNPPLKISEDQKAMMHLGKYPVMVFNFKNLRGDSYRSVMLAMKHLIHLQFKKYYWLTKKKIGFENKKMFFQYLKMNVPDDQYIKTSIGFLTKLIHKFFKRRLVFFIDDEDFPVLNYLRNNYFDKEGLEKIHLMTKGFIKALGEDPNVHQGFIFGTMHIKETSTYLPEYYMPYSLNDPSYNQLMGFTSYEIDQLLLNKTFIYNTTKKDIKKWYSGYNFGGIEMYNPWSVLKCIENKGKLDNYWTKHSQTRIIRKGIPRDVIYRIKSDDGVCIENLHQLLNFNHIRSYPTFVKSLMHSGYLTNFKNRLYIPNKEIYKFYSNDTYFQKVNQTKSMEELENKNRNQPVDIEPE